MLLHLRYKITPHETKSTFGIIVNGIVNDNSMESQSGTPIGYEPTKTVVKILEANNRSFGERSNININTNYRYVDTSGKELNLDADYAHYDILSNQMQPNVYFDPTGQIEQSRIVYNMISPTNIDLCSFKTDYEQPFKKGKLGIGGKVSFVNTDNDFQRYNVYSSGRWESQQFRMNFSYRFGNSQVKAARQRKAALEEEAKQTQGSGGMGNQ